MSTVTTITDGIAVQAAAIVSRVVDLHEAPEWMQQDPLILRGYRKQQDCFSGCLSSLWYVHNETVNVWSHLSVGLCFIGMAVWASFPALHGDWAFAPSDLRAFQAYLVGAALCCMFSAFYHCSNCHSPDVARRCLKLDYLGISCNITSTCISATYFGLHDQKFLASVYISLILACGLAAFWAVLDPKADGPHMASTRAIIFIALGASGFAPIVHAAFSPSLSLGGFPMAHILAESGLYLLGTSIYVIRFPEKYWSRTFDVWGASHQIFHVLVNVAQIVHLLGLRSCLLRHYGLA